MIEQLLASLRSGDLELVDLTQPLSEKTPVIALPPPFPNTPGFSLSEISRYDDERGAWYWNAISTGEHVGTHVDAPNHWITGRDGLDISQIPLDQLVAPAVVIDKSAECAADPDFLLEPHHLKEWQAQHGAFPDGSWLLYRTGWDARAQDKAEFLNANETGPHTPGVSVDGAKYLAASEALIGLGVETVGTDAGAAHSFSTPFPCHNLLLGAGKYGLTQLANVGRLPATGSMVVIAPLPIVGGSGSPARVIAIVPRA
jgi:kynurenine formamidase